MEGAEWATMRDDHCAEVKILNSCCTITFLRMPGVWWGVRGAGISDSGNTIVHALFQSSTIN